MDIVLGSKNGSKKRSIEIALAELGITDYTISCIDVPSRVSSKPINEEILLGAQNRNIALINYCQKQQIDYDLLISIEGGYEQIEDKYFVITYADLLTKDGQRFTGKSQGMQISKKMFEWVQNGKSLNKVIESIIGTNGNKTKSGITGYLSNGRYSRDEFDADAIIMALTSMKNNELYLKLDGECGSRNGK